MAQFLPAGSAGEIGASCFYLNIDGTGVVLDSGTHPRKEGICALPQFDLFKDLPVDFGIISHAHQDHLGSLPFLVRRHPYIRLFATPQTRAIAELTLHDAVSILQGQFKDDDPVRPYTHEEIDLLTQSILTRPYGEAFPIEGLRQRSSVPLNATFFDAGHILGSAGILIEQNGSRIFFTGDVNLDAQTLLPGASLPNGTVDVLVLESTLGATDSSTIPSWGVEAGRLAKRANDVLEEGGSILMPVFALGKMQEMLALVWQLMERGRLPRVPVYTGGIGWKINRLYDQYRYAVPRVDGEFELAAVPQENIFKAERVEEFFRKPCIVLASSGMMIEGTMSFKLAKRWLMIKRNAIFTVGYMDPLTPGYRVLMAERGSRIQLTDFEDLQTVKCSIERFRFTAHAKREGLLEVVRRLRPKRVVLVHGDESAVDWMGYSILASFPGTKVHVAETGKVIEI
ncbi:MAG: MBL fold metallo-hydrolase [Ignavibacteriales bacterium CG07_land_8_20_14_0_80_59_12]|nr:MAG: MBL fold metallo-hydrolase [Ignavibacteriales bacterium CG07_land_8_20_14_0_80_59_12]